MADAPFSLSNPHLDSFSFRWDLGLDCEDEDRSVSDYGTVLHAGETDPSVPLTVATGLSAVEEITEGGLTDSRTASTANRLTLSMPPSSNEVGLLPPGDREGFEATKGRKTVLDRLRSASNRLVPRLSTSWFVLTPPPVVTARVNPSGKVSSAPRPRPKNKLRKKTRPSIAVTLAAEPPSSSSLAQPLARSLEAGTNSVSVSPVTGFSSARSFFSFELPPVFSKARSKVLQKSKYKPSNDMGVTNRTPAPNPHDAISSGSPVRGPGRLTSQDGRPGKNDERAASVDNDAGGSKEGTSASRRLRFTSPWELDLGLGQDLGLRVCSFWRARGRP